MAAITISSDTKLQSLRASLAWILPVVAFSALTVLSAHFRFYLPGTPVPITLQSFVVILAGASLGAWRGLLSQVLVVFLASLGLQAYSTTASGVGVLLGSTGGYILGFMLAAFVAGVMKDRRLFRSFVGTYLFLFLASGFIFLPGVLWLKTLLNLDWSTAVALGLTPFIIGDIVKTFAATVCVWSAKRLRR